MDLLTYLLLAALLCVVAAAGVAAGRVWAYRRACDAAREPEAAAPDVVASLAPIWKPRAR